MNETGETTVGIDPALLQRITDALNSGGEVILTPDPSSNLPPFVICAADKATPTMIGRLSSVANGQTFLALSDRQCERLGLEVNPETTPAGYNQVDAIDAREGIGTGLSAEDRSHTIRLASSPAATSADFVKPGHVLPLRAARSGVLERSGPTEASVDLMKICGCGDAAVLAPLLDRSDSDDLSDAPEVSVEQVTGYRWAHDRLMPADVSVELPTPDGDFRAMGFEEPVMHNIHLALVAGDLSNRKDVLVSYHRECVLGSNFHGRLCNCRSHLETALERTQESGGILIFSQLSDRAGGDNPLASCEAVRLAAGEDLGEREISRDFRIVAQILKELKVETVRWLGDSPPRDPAIEVSEVEPYPA